MRLVSGLGPVMQSTSVKDIIKTTKSALHTHLFLGSLFRDEFVAVGIVLVASAGRKVAVVVRVLDGHCVLQTFFVAQPLHG